MASPLKSVQSPQVPAVPYWRTTLGETEAASVREAILSGHLSQGPLTEEFERRLAGLLGIPYVVCTTSGSAAIYLALAALGIGPGDEVIVPNRTFVATAHAVLLTGAKVKLLDCHKQDPLIDEDQIEQQITPCTKAIVPVHLNGNSANMGRINAIANRHGLRVVEDAAQAFYSKGDSGFLGTEGDAGCFSLGPTKFITTGQGGFVATRDANLYDRMIRFRSHGVHSTFAADYQVFGFNLKFNDVAAAIGLVQLDKTVKKKEVHSKIYNSYRRELADLSYLEILPVDEAKGRLPLWVEALAVQRDKVIGLLAEQGIETRPFLRDLDRSRHLGNMGRDFPNSRKFSAQGLFLPCGPDLAASMLERSLEAIRAIAPRISEP